LLYPLFGEVGNEQDDDLFARVASMYKAKRAIFAAEGTHRSLELYIVLI
jgi:hypothetical protein